VIYQLQSTGALVAWELMKKINDGGKMGWDGMAMETSLFQFLFVFFLLRE
jgi:hypothetical protein